jgi:hypothetical protein
MIADARRAEQFNKRFRDDIINPDFENLTADLIDEKNADEIEAFINKFDNNGFEGLDNNQILGDGNDVILLREPKNIQKFNVVLASGRKHKKPFEKRTQIQSTPPRPKPKPKSFNAFKAALPKHKKYYTKYASK